jgi:hypothetical protein
VAGRRATLRPHLRLAGRHRARRRPVERQQQHSTGRGGNDGDQIGALHAQRGAGERQGHQRDGDAEWPRIHIDRHCGGDLPPGEPVCNDFRHQHVQQHAAEPRQQPPAKLRRPADTKRHDQAAHHHQPEAGQHTGLVAEAPPERPAGQSQHDTGRQIQPDQQAQISEPDAEISAHQRTKRGDALELECHRRSNDEQQRDDTPAQRHGQPLNISVILA